MIKLKQINDHELINLKSNYIKYSDNYFKYNYDFILMKYETYEAFIKDLRLSYKNSNYCLFFAAAVYKAAAEDDLALLVCKRRQNERKDQRFSADFTNAAVINPTTAS